MYVVSNSGSEEFDIEYRGLPVYSDQVSISLSSGWNRVGYLPRANLSVNDAMVNLSSAADGDLLKSQSEFTTYISGYGWFGSLERMYPDLGYMIKVANGQSFNYPAGLIEAPTEGGAKLISVDTDESIPDVPWAVEPGKFENSMMMVALIDGPEYGMNDPYDAVIGMIGNEVRGVSRPEYIPALESYRLFMMVHGQSDENLLTTVSFRIYDHDMEYVYEAVEMTPYDENELVGAVDDPFVLTRNIQRGDKGYIPEEFALDQNYPNPFNPLTHIGFGLPEDSRVEIMIYDLSGRLIRSLLNDNLEAGYRTIMWDGRDDISRMASAGMYIAVMKANDFIDSRKMVLLK
tara:strand:- start:138 stop:1175 length:1038 start_codon:yes stop_codon:yes gene_type:complete